MICSIVDTNVVLVANGKHEDVSQECVASCALRLQAIMQSGKLALDENFRILRGTIYLCDPSSRA